MTPADLWLTSREPDTLLWLLPGERSRRKLCLFALACCRQVQRRMGDKRSRAAVLIAARHADGQATPERLAAAVAAARKAFAAARRRAAARNDEVREIERDAAHIACRTAEGDFIGAAEKVVELEGAVEDYSLNWDRMGGSPEDDAISGERRARACQARLLRDLFGNPFRSVAFDPAWGTEKVLGLARAFYKRPDKAGIAALHEALVEAGCAEPDILAHCTSKGPHVRGCWVVDRLLGKS